MANKRKCKPDISNRCFTKMNAKCVDYEGKLFSCSNLDEDDCVSVHDVLEELSDVVEDNLCLTDFNEDSCLDYEPSDSEKGLTAKDVLITHDTVLCSILESIECNNCAKCDKKGKYDDCGNPIPDDDDDDKDCCCDFLKGKTKILNTRGGNINWEIWQPITNANLGFTATKSGTYKVTVEGVYYWFNNEGLYDGCILGLGEGVSVNGNPPDNDLFSSEIIPLPPTLVKSSSFYIMENISAGDVLDIFYKMEVLQPPSKGDVTPESIEYAYIKVLYELINC